MSCCGKLDRKEPLDETNARRRGRVAACLIVLESSDRVWALLRNALPEDPTERTELIHDLAAYGVPASGRRPPFGRDRCERGSRTDPGARRILPAALPEPVRHAVTERLLQRYATDGDPGTHSAIDWLLRTRWELKPQLDSLDESWRGQAVSAGRNWFVNSEGVTMAVVAIGKPVEFEIGSPEDEDGRESDERIHAVRLDHSYAIATREVNQRSSSDFARPARRVRKRLASSARLSASAGWPRPSIATGSAGARTCNRITRSRVTSSRSPIRLAWVTVCPLSLNGSTRAARVRDQPGPTARQGRFSMGMPGSCSTPTSALIPSAPENPTNWACSTCWAMRSNGLETATHATLHWRARDRPQAMRSSGPFQKRWR